MYTFYARNYVGDYPTETLNVMLRLDGLGLHDERFHGYVDGLSGDSLTAPPPAPRHGTCGWAASTLGPCPSPLSTRCSSPRCCMLTADGLMRTLAAAGYLQTRRQPRAEDGKISR